MSNGPGGGGPLLPDVAGSTSLGADLGRAIGQRGLRRVGIDNWFLFPAADYLALRATAPDTEFVPTLAISYVRAVKIEPCLLKEGVGGTRIEDVLVVQDDGCEVLTDTPRGLFPDGAVEHEPS